MILASAEKVIHLWQLAFQRIAVALHHAACDHKLLTAPLLFEVCHFEHGLYGLFGGGLNKGASVDHNNVGVIVGYEAPRRSLQTNVYAKL